MHRRFNSTSVEGVNVQILPLPRRECGAVYPQRFGILGGQARLLPAARLQTANYVARVAFSYPKEQNGKKWQEHLIAQRAQPLEAKRDLTVMPAMITAEMLNFAYIVTRANEQLRPVRVFDDGAKTYIQIPPEIQNAGAPVLIVLGWDGKREITNYRVQHQTYIVDRIFERAQLILGARKKAQKVEITREQHPKDNSDKPNPDVKPIQAPAGLDLHPKLQTSVRVSKRAGAAVGLVAVGLLLAFAYGGYRRQVRAQAAAHDSTLSKAVLPATASASEVEREIPSGNAPLVRNDQHQLQPSDSGKTPSGTSAGCGFDPRSGQAFCFNPETGQRCAGYPQDRVVVRQPPATHTPLAQTPVEPTPEDRRIAAAYQREQEAMIAPTGIRSGGFASGTFSNAGFNTDAIDDLATVGAPSQSIGRRAPSPSAADAAALLNTTSRNDPDYDGQNMQAVKAAFLSSAQKEKNGDYLQSARTAPLSAYEINAGWKIRRSWSKP